MTPRSYPDRENTLTLLGEWARHHAAVAKMLDGIKASMGIDPDGVMFVTVWALFGEYTSTLAVEVGDFEEWLDWYRFETDMGKRSKAVVVDGKSKRIKTLTDLCRVIEWQRK